MLGWHFTSTALRDGTPLPAINEWHVYEGRSIVRCVYGLHASEHPFDALRYAPGNLLHRVELVDDLLPHGDPVDKYVGRRRRIIASIDAEQLLFAFARWCALQVVDNWPAPQVVKDWLETGDPELQSAAWSAAWSAAEMAVLAAASPIVLSAILAAIRTAAQVPAQSSAWLVELNQRNEFERLVNAAFADLLNAAFADLLQKPAEPV